MTLVASLLLFGSLTMAESGGNNAAKDNSGQHHSVLSKAAFWRHHKGADKNGKAHARKAQQAQANTAQVKPVSAKQAGKREQTQYASNKNTSSIKKSPVAHTQSAKTAQDAKTLSSKQ